MNKWVKRAIGAVAVAAGAASSFATTVTSSTNNPLTFTWAFDGDSNGTQELTGNGSMTISGWSTSQLSVLVTLNNTSAIGGNGGQRLTSFGFGIDPNATSVGFNDASDGGMINASLSSIPSLAKIEVCAFGGPNCSGGGNGGIFGGASDTFTILLNGTWGSSVNIAPVGFKYQTGYGSFEFTTSSSGVTTTSSGRVSEPGTGSLALLGAGLLAVGFGLRRKTAALAV